MSALGQKQTFAVQNVMSALHPKADMCGATRDVRFVPIADICDGAKSLHAFGVCGPPAPAAAARRLATKMPPMTNTSPAVSTGVTVSPRNRLASRIATIGLSVR